MKKRPGAPMLSGLEAVQANPHLLVSERAGTHSFRIWGGWISALGAPGAPQRKPLLATYTAFLILLIVYGGPDQLDGAGAAPAFHAQALCETENRV